MRQRFGVGGDGGESNSPSTRVPGRICYRLIWCFALAPPGSHQQFPRGASRLTYPTPIGVGAVAPRIYGACSPTSRDGRDRRSYLVRQLERVVYRQLLFCHLFFEVDGTSACNPPESSPVEPARPQLALSHILCLKSITCTSRTLGTTGG